jgi:hypothetical protein
LHPLTILTSNERILSTYQLKANSIHVGDSGESVIAFLGSPMDVQTTPGGIEGLGWTLESKAGWPVRTFGIGVTIKDGKVLALPEIHDFKDPSEVEKFRRDTRRSYFVLSHPDLSPETQEDILAGRIRIGMTMEEVRAARGVPDQVTRSAARSGLSETWVNHGSFYVFFEDGKTTSWHDMDASPR